MSIQHHATGNTGSQTTVIIEDLPDECTYCHHKGSFSAIVYFHNSFAPIERRVEAIFRCPNAKCYEVLIGYYKQNPGGTYSFYSMEPQKYVPKTFSEIIKEISKEFSTIYNEALQAEKEKLDQICGPGYRKALEFLIKDYLIGKAADVPMQEAIKNELLGTCISTRISDIRIKEVAKRAAWLGNDETHYVRKWDEKDLQDLKNLINLVIHWMEAEALTTQMLKDMPESGPGKAA